MALAADDTVGRAAGCHAPKSPSASRWKSERSSTESMLPLLPMRLRVLSSHNPFLSEPMRRQAYFVASAAQLEGHARVLEEPVAQNVGLHHELVGVV